MEIDFSHVNYEIRLIHKNNRFFLYIDELSCYTSNENFDDAYAALLRKKDELLETLIEMGMEDKIPLPRKQRVSSRLRPSFGLFFFPFAVKYIVVVVTVIVLSGLLARLAGSQLGAGIGYRIGSSFQSSLSTGLSDLDRQIQSRALEALSNFQTYLENIPPDERENIRLRWRKKLGNLKPIIQEFKAILDEPLPENERR